ncbi:DUF5710 domain-containing protein [Rhodobacteraceae bacterium]|nr:DUF5710 domain-containing protein [Paracoccaceae bacterium]
MITKRLIKVNFREKDEAKALGARWESALKCWYIPQGIDPIKLRDWWRYLDCPFDEKDEARRLGAKWDKHVKKWFVPIEKDYDDFEDWWPEWVKERISIQGDADEEVGPTILTVTGQAGGSFCFLIDPNYSKSGGTAEVYFGWRSEELEEDSSYEDGSPSVAIKFFNNDPDDNSDFTMFERELDALKKLSPHKNIVKLLDYGLDKSDNTFFIVTKYHSLSMDDILLSQFSTIEVLGEELDLSAEHAEQREADKNKTGEEIWIDSFDEVLGGVLEGLIHAFDQGIMHRDLKPGNILFSSDDETEKLTPLLIDFGIASRSENLSTHQATVGNVGTNLYTPENTEEEKKSPGARDVYSWGVIAVECLANEPVRTYSDLIRIFEDEIEPNFPQSIGVILGNCISLRANKRPKNVKELSKLLQIAHAELRV